MYSPLLQCLRHGGDPGAADRHNNCILTAQNCFTTRPMQKLIKGFQLCQSRQNGSGCHANVPVVLQFHLYETISDQQHLLDGIRCCKSTMEVVLPTFRQTLPRCPILIRTTRAINSNTPVYCFFLI